MQSHFDNLDNWDEKSLALTGPLDSTEVCLTTAGLQPLYEGVWFW
jgi:hypothetical protein